MRVSVLVLALSPLVLVGAAQAQDAPPPPPPEAVRALTGCWQGEGAVMGKPVAISLTARGVANDAMIVVEAASQAKADPADTYAAHLLFGGRSTKDGKPASIIGFWADSFGGDGASQGAGSSTADGFEIAYPYGASSFVNHWTLKGERLKWSIAVRGAAGVEQTFASYELAKASCTRG